MPPYQVRTVNVTERTGTPHFHLGSAYQAWKENHCCFLDLHLGKRISAAGKNNIVMSENFFLTLISEF